MVGWSLSSRAEVLQFILCCALPYVRLDTIVGFLEDSLTSGLGPLGFLDGWKRSHHHKHGCPKRTLAVFSHDPKVTGGRESATLPQFSHLANGNSNASLGVRSGFRRPGVGPAHLPPR